MSLNRRQKTPLSLAMVPACSGLAARWLQSSTPRFGSIGSPVRGDGKGYHGHHPVTAVPEKHPKKTDSNASLTLRAARYPFQAPSLLDVSVNLRLLHYYNTMRHHAASRTQK